MLGYSGMEFDEVNYTHSTLFAKKIKTCDDEPADRVFIRPFLTQHCIQQSYESCCYSSGDKMQIEYPSMRMQEESMNSLIESNELSTIERYINNPTLSVTKTLFP